MKHIILFVALLLHAMFDALSEFLFALTISNHCADVHYNEKGPLNECYEL